MGSRAGAAFHAPNPVLLLLKSNQHDIMLTFWERTSKDSKIAILGVLGGMWTQVLARIFQNSLLCVQAQKMFDTQTMRSFLDVEDTIFEDKVQFSEEDGLGEWKRSSIFINLCQQCHKMSQLRSKFTEIQPKPEVYPFPSSHHIHMCAFS